MPTGYTADIAKGITFPQFAMTCARAWGATITMRDEPLDTPIPEKFKPSTWDKKELLKAQKALAEINNLSIEEATEKAKAEYKSEKTRYKQYIADDMELKEKYEAMLEQVKSWIPPSPDHKEFKDFMVEQITGSIKFDCGIDYYKEELAKLRCLTGEEYIRVKRDKILKDIEYHTEEDRKERERTAERNKWLKALRQSIAEAK